MSSTHLRVRQLAFTVPLAFAPLGIAMLIALAGSGCTVGPNYTEPKPTAADRQWAANGSPDASRAGLSTDGAEVASWWRSLGDAQLTTLIERAVSGNQDVRLAQLRIAEARAIRGVVAADGLPQVAADGRYNRYRDSERTGNLGRSTEMDRDFFQGGFDASWELDIFGGIRRGVEASEADIAAAEATLRDVLVSLSAEVARTYVDLRSNQEQLSIARRNIAIQADAVSLSQSKFNGGLTSELDVVQASTQLATTRATIPALEATVLADAHRLGVLLGLDPTALRAELEASKPLPIARSGLTGTSATADGAKGPAADGVPVSGGAIAGDGSNPGAMPRLTGQAVPIGQPADMLRRRPDLRAAERRIAAATARIGVATAELYPKVSLLGSFSMQAETFTKAFDMDARAWSIGPKVTWSVFSGGRVQANISTFEQREKQALVTYEQSVLKALEEAETALVRYAKAQERREQLRLAVLSGRRGVELADSLYKAGRTGFLNVLDAQRSLLGAESSLAEADLAVTTNLIAVYKAVGGGWEGGMAVLVPEAKSATAK